VTDYVLRMKKHDFREEIENRAKMVVKWRKCFEDLIKRTAENPLVKWMVAELFTFISANFFDYPGFSEEQEIHSELLDVWNNLKKNADKDLEMIKQILLEWEVDAKAKYLSEKISSCEKDSDEYASFIGKVCEEIPDNINRVMFFLLTLYECDPNNIFQDTVFALVNLDTRSQFHGDSRTHSASEFILTKHRRLLIKAKILTIT